VSKLGRLSRIFVFAALAALALAGGQPAAVAAPPVPHDHNCHLTTWIQGAVENRTTARIVLGQEGLGRTNVWCQQPGDDIRARATDSWRAGDDAGGTDVFLVYLLETGDLVLFQARIPPGGPPTAGCSFTEVVQPPVRFACDAEVVMAAGSFAFVRFTLRPR
jgi:hypothetical protein